MNHSIHWAWAEIRRLLGRPLHWLAVGFDLTVGLAADQTERPAVQRYGGAIAMGVGAVLLATRWFPAGLACIFLGSALLLAQWERSRADRSKQPPKPPKGRNTP